MATEIVSNAVEDAQGVYAEGAERLPEPIVTVRDYPRVAVRKSHAMLDEEMMYDRDSGMGD